MIRVPDAEALREMAARLAGRLAPREGRATVIALSGPLGAGKTTFAQGFARGLGVEEPVLSPTFVIQRSYAVPTSARRPPFRRLVHVDAYRLEDAAELSRIGFADVLRDARAAVLIEWPERVEAIVPRDARRIVFDMDGDGRIIRDDGEED